jgi:Response regulator containing CheY-like receiver domain and AraC-type DNA-binding domain
MYNLLIAEDEEEIREGIKSWLESQMSCYNVFTAKNGLKALEIMENTNIHFILLDMRMPEMDGISFLKEIKMKGLSAIIVVLSGFDDFKYAQAALEYGASRYLLKPATPDELVKVATEIKSVLDNKAAMAAEADFIREYLKQGTNVDVSGKIPDLSFDMNEFMADLRMGLCDEVKNKVKSFFEDHRKSISKTRMDPVYIFTSLVNAALASTLNSTGIPMSKVFSDYSNPFIDAYKFCNPDEAEAWLLSTIDKVMPYFYEARGYKTKSIVQQAKKIIEENYKLDINTEILSKMLFLNKDYLGRIFKLSSGFSVNDYINRVRTAKAKELLREGRLKVYEIAEQVGYSDEHYFSTLFKKNTGMTPSEYK